MSVKLSSTRVKVRDSEKVRGILDAYETEGVEIQLQDDRTLEMAFEEEDPNWSEWPLALHRDQWPDEDRFPDVAISDTDPLEESAWDKAFEEKGKEGFLSLLRELASYLESPLLVLVTARTYDFNFAGATVWLVQPGTTEVQSLEVFL
jgi:hypothetical protein